MHVVPEMAFCAPCGMAVHETECRIKGETELERFLFRVFGAADFPAPAGETFLIGPCYHWNSLVDIIVLDEIKAHIVVSY